MDKPGTRIAFVAPSAYRYGGLATWLNTVLPDLSQLGWSPTLVLVNGSWHQARVYLKLNPFSHAVVVNNPTGSREGRVRAFGRCLEELDPDMVVSVNIPDAINAVQRLRASTGRYRRAVMTLHGFVPEIFADVATYQETLDGVVCTNRLASELVAAFSGFARERTWYAPGGVEVPESASRRVHDPGKLRLGFVGRLDQREKRVQDLLSIFFKLCNRGLDVTLCIVGSGPEEASLRQRVLEAGLESRVRFTGFLRPEQISTEIFPELDVLLITSPSETGPLVAWEAMARGVAVACSRFIGSGCEGALVHGRTAVLFEIGDIAEAADAVQSLLDMRFRGTLTCQARAIVCDRYSRAASAAAWNWALRQIMAGSPLGPPVQVDRPTPAGRLDRWVGTGLAETLRTMLGLRFEHSDPGGEWPHAYGAPGLDPGRFWALARQFDAHEVVDAALPPQGRADLNVV